MGGVKKMKYYPEIMLAIAAFLCDIVWLSKYHSGSGIGRHVGKKRI